MAEIISLLLLIVAIIAAIISYREYGSHKTKEYNKLLSQLNKRYVGNVDVQTVVKYLRYNDPTKEEPKAYQIDLFLRFFEELGVYLKSESLKRDDVLNFFGYYMYRFDNCKRGQRLKEIIKHEDETLDYLNDYRRLIELYPKDWMEVALEEENINTNK
jgi:hypothetical protein